jgi:isopropylmalate/homocitrate/citramalate synthase
MMQILDFDFRHRFARYDRQRDESPVRRTMSNSPKNGMWPSPYNQASGAAIASGRRILFADCTLRDGEQQAGVVFDRAAKVAIARALDDLGIYEIEAGTVASSEEDRQAMAEMCGLGLNAKISALCRGLNTDMDHAVDLGVWGARLSFPISQLERKYKLKGISDDEYLRRALELCEYGRSKGLNIIFSPYDTTRAEIPFLRRLVGELERAGTVNRLRIVDTTGCALPVAITYIIEQIREAAPTLPLEIHCHNDFGLACANTLAGIVAGADYASTTINGLGERSGNAATEEVAMALEVLYSIPTGLDLTKLTAVSRFAHKLTKQWSATARSVTNLAWLWPGYYRTPLPPRPISPNWSDSGGKFCSEKRAAWCRSPTRSKSWRCRCMSKASRKYLIA